MFTTKSIGIGTGLITGVAGLTVAVGYSTDLFDSKELSNPNTQINESSDRSVLHSISGKLKEEGFIVLNTTKNENSDWTTILTAYKLEKTNTFTGQEDKGSNVNEAYLQSKCAEILNNKADDISNYKLAKRWCVKEETINTILQKRGYTVLSAGEDKSNETNAWKKLVQELLKDNSKFAVAKLTQGPQKEDMNIKALKAGCQTLKTEETKTTSSDFETNIELTQSWCSVKGNVS
ncbi:hypothetical protein A6V39_03555 [Candidatus Mycoplasma haematobovis]|uniref:Uncharacterized protein n=1 Tax=Candidatus Mycoplasma haematobovis TaxID=432608 RepID=A0A1A9QBK1_9MOLU|nr:hypothetical protein [Candidatus Mycoplasma haematobovis]OAL09962.1 hypothetical protein A6V39_03555 [Candidatus Mycoplasma haematobovis]